MAEYRKILSRWKRRAEWSLGYLKGPREDYLRFRCNVCGNQTSYPRSKTYREFWSCWYCKSSVRWRSVIHALSNELFGESLALPDFPNRPDIVGIGLSDWDGYAIRLAKKLSYTNTYYHQEPLFDITSVDPEKRELYDFIISSDVFEHVAPPISKAFENAQRLLKPNGVMILTVPYIKGTTSEHFPDLHQFSLEKRNEHWILHNRTTDGRTQEYSDLTFHGGPGTVIEMRLFGKESLLKDVHNAGFESVRIYDQEYPEQGLIWIPYDAERAPYRPLIYGLDTPAWALRKRDLHAATGESR